MSRPPIMVERLEREALDEATTALVAAFLDYPITVRAFTGLSRGRRIRRLRRVLRSVIAAAILYGQVDVIRQDARPDRAGESHLSGDSCQEGKIVAVSVTYPPGSYPLSLWGWIVNALGTMSVGVRPALRYATFDGYKTTHHLHAPHWYLHSLGVTPTWQGHGLGSALVKAMSARATRDGCACYVETLVPRVVALYERHGYHIVHHGFIKDLEDLEIWTLVRDKE